MAAPDTTRSEIANEINNFYDNVLLKRAVPNLVHGLFGQKRNVPLNSGSNVIKFRRYGSLSATTTALTEGTTPTGSSLSTTDITATVLPYGGWTRISDVVSLTTLDPILTETSEVFGEQMADSFDQLARNIIVAGTTVQYASTATARGEVTAAMKLTLGEILEAIRTLKTAKARKITSVSGSGVGVGTIPVDASYVGIVHPRSSYDLKQLSGWDSVETYAGLNGNAQAIPHEIGKLDEARFVESSNAKVFTGEGASSADVYATVILGADAYGTVDLGNSQSSGIIYKGLGSAGSADPLNQRQTLGWKSWYVAKVLNDAFMVRIEHGVTS